MSASADTAPAYGHETGVRQFRRANPVAALLGQLDRRARCPAWRALPALIRTLGEKCAPTAPFLPSIARTRHPRYRRRPGPRYRRRRGPRRRRRPGPRYRRRPWRRGQLPLPTMKLLITGAAGMLGTDVRAASAGDHEVVALSRAELDISDRDAVRAVVAAAQPDAVINCAAYTNVDGAESDPDAAAAANATGPGFLAEAAAEADAWIVHVSTDYVFDGTKTSPYVESDPTGPRSTYGSTKLLGERAVAIAAPDRHTVVRSSWLFGT